MGKQQQAQQKPIFGYMMQELSKAMEPEERERIIRAFKESGGCPPDEEIGKAFARFFMNTIDARAEEARARDTQ